MQKYGGIIWQERLKNNMQANVLANILLLSEEELDEVETGKTELSDVRLNICANIFRISKEAMIQGVRKDALSDDEIRERLQDINRQISGLKPEKTFENIPEEYRVVGSRKEISKEIQTENEKELSEDIILDNPEEHAPRM